MRVEEFDFRLPKELIALRPASPRSAARMLVVTRSRVVDSTIDALSDWLRRNDILVFNDTKVLPVRLNGTRWRKDTEAVLDITLLHDLGEGRWQAMVRPLKRMRSGDTVIFGDGFFALVEEVRAGRAILSFKSAGAEFHALLARFGRMPLPPYIAKLRPPDRKDDVDYQTAFAATAGAVASPTAGLHFDGALLSTLDAVGVRRAAVTLHVGPGTFLPVRAQQMETGSLEREWGRIGPRTAAAMEAANAEGGRTVAVGTTSMRLLESAVLRAGRFKPWTGTTDLFILPGFRFRATDALLTNFHLPRSSLFMLVSAYMGTDRMQCAYAHAIESGYRFFSYGDACLLFPEESST